MSPPSWAVVVYPHFLLAPRPFRTSGGRGSSGRLTDEPSGAGLVPGQVVHVLDATGDLAATALTDVNGSYTTSAVLSTGSSFLLRRPCRGTCRNRALAHS